MSRSLTSTVLVMFSDLPEARIILGASLKPDGIKEGADVYFDCVVNALPPSYKVEWKLNVSTRAY